MSKRSEKDTERDSDRERRGQQTESKLERRSDGYIEKRQRVTEGGRKRDRVRSSGRQ